MEVSEAADAKIVSFGEKYKNEIIDFDMVFDFTDKDKKVSSYDGFMLRASKNDAVCWGGNDCYVIIVRENSVEIQSFYQGENVFYLNRTCEIPKNKKVNVKLGAVDTEKGTYLFIKIDDKLYGAYDTKSRIKNEGYFALEWRSTVNISEAEKSEATIFAPTLKYDVKENKIIAENLFISGETEDVNYKWYMSNDVYINAERDLTSLSENFTLVDGEESDSFMVMDSDIGKYVYCEIAAGGVTLNSEICHISPVEYIKEYGFTACVGYRGAIANGKAFVFDKENSNVYADCDDEFAYLPLRSIAEAYGMPVEWIADEQIVSISAVGEGDTSLKIGKQGFIRLRNLMGSSMPGVPYIREGRTFIDASAMMQILNYKSLVYDENSGLVTFTNSAVALSDDEIQELVYAVEEIK